MTIKFCFGNLKKNGTKNLKIRLKRNGKDRKIAIKDVYIKMSCWDNSNYRVKSSCPNSKVINEIISDYKIKIVEVAGLLELKQINFNTAILMLSNSSSTESIFEFIEVHCKNKSVQWKRNTVGVLNSLKNHLGLEDICFDDVTIQNINKLKELSDNKTFKPETYNNYLRHLRAVYNYALETKITFRDFNFKNEFFIKVNKHNKKLLTHTSEDIMQAIGRIKLKRNNEASKEYALRDIEAVGFWLLKFSLRGFYGKDITSLTSFDSDYNYDYRAKYMSVKGVQKEKEIKGNPYFLDHHRHKTGNIMRLWITLPPIGGLIFILKRLVANTHPNLSYLSKDDLTKTSQELYETKNYDILKIFKHETEDYKRDDALWNNLNKHLKSLGLYSFESARKSFNTTATHLGIHQSITKTLVGQSDSSIQQHYNNYNDIRLVKSVQESHLRIMHSFKMIELFDRWVLKLDEIFGGFLDFRIGADSNIVYLHQHDFLKTILKSNLTLIENKPFWKDSIIG